VLSVECEDWGNGRERNSMEVYQLIGDVLSS
jgi:hypothetical protein